MSIALDLPSDSAATIRTQQLLDPDVGAILRCCEGDNDEDARRWMERGYYVSNGVLYRLDPVYETDEPQLVLPNEKVEGVLRDAHSDSTSGHYGVDKTLSRLRQRYHWRHMRRDVIKYVKACTECQRYKPSNVKPPGLLQTPVASQRFEVLAMDLFGPLPETSCGKRWVLAIEDVASRWIELFALEQATAEACARCLVDEVILRYGCPRRIISDNGVQFVSATMQYVAHTLGFKQNLIPVYHPAANPEERRNRDLKTQLAILCGNDHTTWQEALPSVRFAMNAAQHSATGRSPAYLTFARELRSPDWVAHDLRPIHHGENLVTELVPYLARINEVLMDANCSVQEQQDRAKRYADAHRSPGPDYQPGDLVLVDTHCLSNRKAGFSSKLAPRRDGPYQVMRRVTATTYEVADPSKPNEPLGKYHVGSLTPFHSPDDHETPVPSPVVPIRRRGRPKKAPARGPGRPRKK